MRNAGVLLDTGPIVALLSRDDTHHERAVRAFEQCRPPLVTCEAVIAEACFLMRRLDAAGPTEVVSLGRRGVFEIGLKAEEHWERIGDLLEKYADTPVSFADACLIRCAEIRQDARVLTFDRHFAVYRWGRTRKFELI